MTKLQVKGRKTNLLPCHLRQQHLKFKAQNLLSKIRELLTLAGKLHLPEVLVPFCQSKEVAQQSKYDVTSAQRACKMMQSPNRGTMLEVGARFASGKDVKCTSSVNIIDYKEFQLFPNIRFTDITASSLVRPSQSSKF